VGSYWIRPSFAHELGYTPLASYTYVYRASDGELVMFDGGYARWVVGGTLQSPVVEDESDARVGVEAAIRALAPDRTLADIAAIYLEHGHPDHIGQAEWIADARSTPPELWLGSGDVSMVATSTGIEACTGTLLPPNAANLISSLIPALTAPRYTIRPVPTAAPATSPSDWVDGGHGVQLIPAPSHTPGTILIYLPADGFAIASNHLRHVPMGSTGDCPTQDSSPCHVDCAVYGESLAAIPSGARILHVHPD